MESLLYTCDLLCYGAASPGAFRAFKATLEDRSGNRLSAYAHRGAGIRTGGDEVAFYEDGSVDSGGALARSWSRTWLKYLCRESCFRCGYHSVDRPGDLSIGDYWGIDRVEPGFNDGWGVSCVLVNNDRGLRLVRGVAGEIDTVRTSVEDVANDEQPVLIHPPARLRRDGFWQAYYDHGYVRACRDVGSLGFARSAKDAVRSGFGRLQAIRLQARRSRKEVMMSQENASRAGSALLGTVQDDDYPVVFAARNRNDGVRRRSSSGGMYYALASYVINDFGGVVYGCAFDDNLRAVHIRCETVAEAECCMGSKYSQSDMGDSIRRVRNDLEAGRTVLFTGTPCQVAAVRAACADIAGGSHDR